MEITNKRCQIGSKSVLAQRLFALWIAERCDTRDCVELPVAYTHKISRTIISGWGAMQQATDNESSRNTCCHLIRISYLYFHCKNIYLPPCCPHILIHSLTRIFFFFFLIVHCKSVHCPHVFSWQDVAWRSDRFVRMPHRERSCNVWPPVTDQSLNVQTTNYFSRMMILKVLLCVHGIQGTGATTACFRQRLNWAAV